MCSLLTTYWLVVQHLERCGVRVVGWSEEGAGCRVEGSWWRVEGGGWKVEGGGWRPVQEREFLIDSLLVQIHIIIEMV